MAAQKQVGIVVHTDDGETIVKLNPRYSDSGLVTEASIITATTTEPDTLLVAMRTLENWTDITPDQAHWTRLGVVRCVVNNAMTIESHLYLAQITYKVHTNFHATSMKQITFGDMMKTCMNPDSSDFKDMVSAAAIPRAWNHLVMDLLFDLPTSRV